MPFGYLGTTPNQQQKINETTGAGEAFLACII